MSLPRPTKTLLFVALLGLLLIGGVLAAPAPDRTRTYEAVQIDPATDANVLAHRSSEIRNLTADAETAADRQLLDRAADGETVRIPRNHTYFGSLSNESGFAVYDGDYYRLNASGERRSERENDRSGEFTLQLTPVSGETVVSELAVPYEETRPAVRRVVDEGRAEVTRLRPENALGTAGHSIGTANHSTGTTNHSAETTNHSAETANHSAETANHSDTRNVSGVAFGYHVPSVVVHDGTYYVLDTASELAPVGEFVGFYVGRIVLPAVQRLGVTYLVLAVGVFGLAGRAGSRAAVTPRAASGLLGGLFLVQLLVTVSQFPTASSAIPTAAAFSQQLGQVGVRILFGVPTAFSTLPLAATFLVGVVWRRSGASSRTGLAVVGVAALGFVHAGVAGLLAQSIFTVPFTLVANAVTLVAAPPLLGLGYVHAERGK